MRFPFACGARPSVVDDHAEPRSPHLRFDPPPHRRPPIVVLAGALLALAGVGAADETAPIDFTRQIQPILAENCFECHGFDAGHREAGLRLDNEEAFIDLGGHQAIVPGDPAASVLLDRVTATDPRDMMPPPETDKRLTEAEVALLRQWIAEGAEYKPHWAFAPVEHPPLPDLAGHPWVRNPIDKFVLQRLQEEGMEPSGEASRPTLARRLSLALTGLPPDPGWVDDFIADERSDAFEQRVAGLLDSPHFGERWAMHWLDIARYGDTGGYDFDRPRDMWLYRDWVIHAFNTDKPFDQFALEQLAGDLLDEATPEQRIATGFIRNSPEPQYYFDVLIDRVNTTGTAFMGLTLECAQCHDHKFDPVSQKEFYQLLAIFNNDDETEFTAASPISGEESTLLVVSERKNPRPTHLAIGGSFLDEGERVDPGAPQELHPLPEGGVGNRRQLAEWLVDPANPLIARVTVNRYWEAMFGYGLVVTSEDLGVRAELPSHPELLDWLAAEFMEQGWSVKWLLRTIATSATYRQSSEAGPALYGSDPQNRLLARGPRFRAPAETVRDISLAAAGLIHLDVGGPSVFPPQPHGISEDRERGAYEWEVSEGPDRYRRGLYTYWKRAALYPGLELFDAPRRETACSRRGRSNNPLQALVTLNDPAFVEAAVALGWRMAGHGDGDDPAARISHGFRLAVSRPPDSAELAALVEFHEHERERFAGDPEAAEKLVRSAPAAADWQAEGDELAQWAALAMVANVLLSLDETITLP